jgi:hypothetical protein
MSAMSYDLERLPDDPVILFKGYKDFGAPNELGQAVGDIMRLLDQQPEPVYLIQDERLHRTPNVEEMIIVGQALAWETRALYRHPMLAGVIIVTANEITQALYQGLNSEVFGHVQVELFDTPDEALAYVRGNQ